MAAGVGRHPGRHGGVPGRPGGGGRTVSAPKARTARIERATSESSVLVELDLDATGDTHIDAHHTVEDVAITIGEALREALGDKRGISRFGDATVPLDEALAQAVVDVSGRPYLVHTGEPPGQEYHLIGGHFTGSLTRHVLESIAHHAAFSIHVRVLAGRDPHHIVEAQFKALARALRFAVALDPRVDGIPSTKGAL